ncbi:DEAD/DEAH box helicase [Clostridium perfringens]|uniref:DNA 3'-5' helicase n=1 Tax=Clostridium perfringens TaxID=1502 RepID=A0AAP4A8G5_CLOPF|nr:DEAD/DEAH box helicase [Clostridium perfringens]MDH2334694.1 helicase-related protein [Clostridium perfringens]
MSSEEKILDALEDVFNDKLAIPLFVKDLENNTNSLNSSKYNIIKRTVSSYLKMKLDKSNGFDFFVNLRQLIITFKRRFLVSNYIIDKFKEIENIDLYLEISKGFEGEYYINSKNIILKWLNDENLLNDFKHIFEKKIAESSTATGDFRLKEMTGYYSYKSYCQKFIIRALEYQEFGTTILATMKTGGGKSLLVQYISKYELDGTTIVVLPTIALTIDQYESSKKYFIDENRKVYAYYEGVSQFEKQKIFNDLEKGKVAILYISPESILNGMFYDKIMECAKKGLLNRLVIDEAHLVLDWGEFFRTEFQFLAVFRRKILNLTNNRLKTVLVSATITDRSEEALENLYSEKNKFIEIRGDSLRDEISFYKIKCKNNQQRKERIKEVIPVILRPMIIYVPTIADANEYYGLIKELGCESVEMFTSDTSTENRRKILNKWDNDEIDVMVATAAFGMGVDKKEVRSIVHTFVPEGIDRFYQEVGRSGRDGYKSYSFLFTSLKEDKEYINYFTRNKVLSANNIVERWYGIMKNPYEKIYGDEYWVSVRGIPEHLLDKPFSGKTNEAWNEYVILFLYRNNFIDIMDVKLDKNNKSRLLHIKLKKIDIMDNHELFIKKIEELRCKNREYIDKDIDNMINMIKEDKVCWGKIFEKTYKYTEAKCIGCPVCRKNKEKHRKCEDYFEIVKGNKILTEAFNKNKEKIKEGLINLENNVLDNIDYIIDLCNREELQCLILPDKELCNKIIDSKLNSKTYLYNYDEAFNIEENMLRGNIGIVMTLNNEDINNKLFRKYNLQYSKDKIKKLLYISDKDVYIKSEFRNIEGCLEKISYIRR